MFSGVPATRVPDTSDKSMKAQFTTFLHENLSAIHQSSSEGPPTFTRVPVKVPSVHGWPSECVQLYEIHLLFL